MALLKRVTTMCALLVIAAVRVIEGAEKVGIADQAALGSTCVSGKLESNRQAVIAVQLPSNMAEICNRTPMAKR